MTIFHLYKFMLKVINNFLLLMKANLNFTKQ